VKIEIITIGDEILSGNIVDTNFAWLGDRLWPAGFELHWHTTVGDEPDEISEALLNVVGRSEAAIVTGGLGPTTDDITVEVAAQAFGLPLVLNQQALKEIQDFFQRVGRPMSPNNEKQALLPEGSRMIPNKVGTAPGCHLVFKGAHFFFLPGVPREMKQQFEDFVLPTLSALDPEKKQFRQKILRCFGAPEATIGQKLEGVDLAGVDLAYRVSFPEIFLKVSARGLDLQKLEKRISEVEAEIRNRLGDLVYGEGDEPLAEVVGQMLVDRKATLSVAESCTGGLLASLITDIPGSSRYFERGVVTYSNESKVEILKVPEGVIKTFGAVSSETAVAMAKGMRRLAKTTYSLAITGIAGPEGGTPEKPVGTVYIALDSESGAEERGFHFPTNRDWFKRLAAFAALDLLRKKLLSR
jgi:nicotinamide-nucleotide amidase